MPSNVLSTRKKYRLNTCKVNHIKNSNERQIHRFHNKVCALKQKFMAKFVNPSSFLFQNFVSNYYTKSL